MSIQAITNLFYFVVLVYMFCYVEVLPFPSKKIRYFTVWGTTAIVVVNIVVFLMFPDIAISAVSAVTQTGASLVLCLLVARHKDMRSLFVFCSLDVVGFMFLILTAGLGMVFGLREIWVQGLQILLLPLYLFFFLRNGKEFRKTMDKVEKSWGLPALFVLIIYGFSYFLILYPVPWQKRPEYAPVIIAYAVLVLFSYIIIVKIVLSMNRIHDMEEDELRMKMRIEMQNKELEEKKTRIALNQIYPHFIFNVLMSIRYFIKKDPQTAYDMVYDFSSYLRKNMESIEDRPYIQWMEELEHINTYLRIEKMRFKDRLQIVYEIEEEDFYIPSLTVEPLVENAVKHGVSKKTEGGTVWIRSRRTATGYQVMVEDDGVGFDVEKAAQENHVGLNYIKARMEMLPGGNMKIESRPGEGTKIWVDFGEVADENDIGG